MKIKLYKKVDGVLRLVDFGIMSCIDLYRQQGYIVRPAGQNDHEAVWAEPKRSFTVHKTSFMDKVRGFFQTLIPEMEVCYA